MRVDGVVEYKKFDCVGVELHYKNQKIELYKSVGHIAVVLSPINDL